MSFVSKKGLACARSGAAHSKPLLLPYDGSSFLCPSYRGGCRCLFLSLEKGRPARLSAAWPSGERSPRCADPMGLWTVWDRAAWTVHGVGGPCHPSLLACLPCTARKGTYGCRVRGGGGGQAAAECERIYDDDALHSSVAGRGPGTIPGSGASLSISPSLPPRAAASPLDAALLSRLVSGCRRELVASARSSGWG